MSKVKDKGRIPDTPEGTPDKLGGKELEERLPAACYS